jgi:ubiquinone/menaquinone biosynthesis C-methylase UbiE
MQNRIADAMIARAEDPDQVRMRRDYLGKLDLPANAKGVELGSGTGDVTRDLIDIAGCTEALGVEPSPIMVERAQQRHADKPGLSFQIGDAKATGLADRSMDLVAMHTLLIHCPGPEEALAEAWRILKPGGLLTVFDQDPPSITASLSDNDPFGPLVNSVIDAYVHDRWLVRRTGPLLSDAGFHIASRSGYLYQADGDAAYFRTIIDRGADRLQADGVIGAELAAALKVEAARRAETGVFFGSPSSAWSPASREGRDELPSRSRPAAPRALGTGGDGADRARRHHADAALLSGRLHLFLRGDAAGHGHVHHRQPLPGMTHG